MVVVEVEDLVNQVEEVDHQVHHRVTMMPLEMDSLVEVLVVPVQIVVDQQI
jgi:hypothetical protein